MPLHIAGSTSRLNPRNWPLKVKFALAPAIALIALVGVGLSAQQALETQADSAKAALQRVNERSLAIEGHLGELHRINADLYRLIAMTAAEATEGAVEDHVAALNGDISAVAQGLQTIGATLNDPAQQGEFATVNEKLAMMRDAVEFVGAMLELDFAAVVSFLQPVNEHITGIASTLSSIAASEVQAAEALSAQVAEQGRAQVWVMRYTLVGAMIIVVLATIVASGWVSKAIHAIAGATRELADGKTGMDLAELQRGDELGEMANSLATIERTAARALRNQAALDASNTAICIVDRDHRVVFVNDSFTALRDALAAEVGAVLPGFAETEAVGLDFAAFHNVVAFDATEVAALSGMVEHRMEIGGKVIDMSVTPVVNPFGDRIATVVDWHEVADQLALEKEVAGMVDAVAAGDLARRVRATGATGFMATLVEGMNTLAATVEAGLAETRSVLQNLAEGDLTQRVEGDYHGAFAELKDATNATGDQLAETIQKIRVASHSAKEAADRIAQGASDLSGRTESQAAALEETAATMEEVAATVKSTAEISNSANQSARGASKHATTGRQVADDAVQAMSDVETLSGRISDITTVIESIAFQTNLLALNAAVEAARAGQSGKGFAVVAAEVRTLAQRTSEAARDISGLVEESVSSVTRGADLVRSTGAAFEEIVGSVSNLAGLVEKIAQAGTEQASGIDEISSSIAQIDGLTQSNAGLVEQSAGAARQLAQEVATLDQLVDAFKLLGGTSGYRHAA